MATDAGAPEHILGEVMQPHFAVAIVTLVALLVYFWMSVGVSRARAKCGVAAPAMTGDPILERNIRVHMNTLEWLPIFLPSMWLFAIYWNDLVAAGLGVVWIIGRIVYRLGYVADPAKRGPGFGIQALACAVLLFGALGRIIWAYATLSA
jgi:glutathione S-transferase